MFAPRSHHIPRTYSSLHPTTTKKNTNKENANGLPTKTPSRPGKMALGGPSTGMKLGMALGVKTEGRDRNVLMGQSQGAGGKGKGREGEDIEPKRLFANAPPKAGSSIPPSKSLSSMPHLSTRTPAPSKRLPPSQTLRTPAPSLRLQQDLPAPTPLPSATRTRRRSRQSLSHISLTPIKASLEEASFVTPAHPGGWEEEASLGSIEEVVEGQMLEGLREVMEEEDGEVEYMPPPVEELPWTPAFDHPDLKSIFETLTLLPPMWAPHEVTIREVPDLDIAELDVSGVRLSGDDELEEEWLRPKTKVNDVSAPSVPKKMVQATKPAPTSIRPGQTPISRVALPSRPTTAASSAALSRRPLSTATKPITKPPAPVPRPPAVKPFQNALRPNPNVARIPSKTTSLAKTAPEMKKVVQKPRKVDEADLKLFASWEDDIGEVETFDLGLDMGVPVLEM
ncbi:hypothetical protein CI109_101295 [Kwoniella shandongensis]|uniref:Uncharacterized protein n=1 Tax=Kwoniella shandongensis TaxID=1734106 RepID=A0A5M6BWW2_9TREE|nr:uncharacterized protein CI109_005329 [Kwoniella shandongensis]KAA5526372.1 hypothetical protein CI109_005329 [Kwoniella shandongensis]